MVKLTDIKAVASKQMENLLSSELGQERDLLNNLPTDTGNHALIISGIRRCGKSTLLNQMIRQRKENAFYINFDTPRLYGFELADFEVLDLAISEGAYKKLYFDEIQVVDGWELYVRQKLDEGYNIVVTGSNASLLSRELGTKLTGRHITKELFPFSFHEYSSFLNLKADRETFEKYFLTGGFPEYAGNNNQDILHSLFNDILFRDIAVRYGIRDVNSLKRLLIFLVSNTGNLVTATKLTGSLEIKSPATVLDYLSYFEQSYLLALMPRFSHSYRAQMVNPRKVYTIDNGLIGAVSSSFTEDHGKKLENMVFWKFRREARELFYFQEKGSECDFVVSGAKEIQQLIQVCYELNHENEAREIRGLLNAMEYFEQGTGVIITMNQKDEIIHNGKRIHVIPAHEFFLHDP